MKRMIALMVVVLVLFSVACESEAAKQARLENEKQLEEQRERERLENEAIVKNITESCNVFVDVNDSAFCFAEAAVENEGIAESLCENAKGGQDLCMHYVAVTLKKSSYCKGVKDPIGCALMANDQYCMNFDNKDSCYESQVSLLAILDADRAVALCRRLGSQYSDAKKACSEIDVSEYSNLTYRERFSVMYVISELMDFRTQTKRR